MGFQFNRPGVIRDGSGVISGINFGRATADISLGIFGIQFNRLGVVGNHPGVVLELAFGHTAIDISIGILGIQFDGPVKIGDGPRIIARLVLVDAGIKRRLGGRFVVVVSRAGTEHYQRKKQPESPCTRFHANEDSGTESLGNGLFEF